MSSDNFDKELSALYQQRKAQIIAPKISLHEPLKARRLSRLSFIAIFSAAGVASFGIMAIMNYLSTAPVSNLPLYQAHHQIEMTKVIPSKEMAPVMAILPPLPVKPIVIPPSKSSLLSADKQVSDRFIEPESIVTRQVQFIILPQLTEPELAIQPIYKVLPKYPVNLISSKQYGAVQLKYQITPAGEVNNISMVKSSVNRQLQQAAKKALSQWQYSPSNRFNDSYEIIFDFTAGKN